MILHAAIAIGARLLVAALLVCVAVGPAAARPGTDAPMQSGYLTAELIAETTTARPGSTFYVALRQTIAPGWHTYWRNPGEGGQATSLAWSLPKGWRAGPMIWPAPERYRMGPFISYVVSGDVLIPVPIEVPADARPGTRLELRARASFLLCKDVCIPERADLMLPVIVSGAAPVVAGEKGQAVVAAREKAANRSRVLATYKLDKGMVTIALPGVTRATDGAYFYAYQSGAIDANKLQEVRQGPEGLVVRAPIYPKASVNEPFEGLLTLAQNQALEVRAQAGPLPHWVETAHPLTKSTDAEGAPTAWGAVLLAFVGGLILNLMPCVFPVLSLKAIALAKHAGRPAGARAEGLAFLGGSLTAFLCLAGVLMAARLAGAQLGWGFQLQSPAIVTMLALVMLLSGLNLSGVYEVGFSLQSLGGRHSGRSGIAGAFFAGALAAVVAAPCTAPLMGPAVGWALTQPPAVALPVFAALGLGLAAPFTTMSFAPRLFKYLPRSGVWLERLKKGLAFPMYGAAAWLAWVLSVQTGGAGLPALFAAAVSIAFAAWAWGIAQRGGGSKAWGAAAFMGVALAVPMGMSAADGIGTGESSGPAHLLVEQWTPERVDAERRAGRPVFVDFTAAWCITCQVNERTALASPAVREAFARTRAVYLKADWTNPDPKITEALASHGRSGVPLYLVYGADGAPKILPQLLTERIVIEAIEAARK